MSVRNTILETLKDEIGEYITTGNDNYEIGVAEVFRGYQLYDDCTNKPAVCVITVEDEKSEEAFGGHYDRLLHLDLMGYTTSDGYTHDDIHSLVRDLEYFLENDFTYKDDIYVGNIIIFEGGVTFPRGEMRMEVTIHYHTTTSNP
jgi:hypothetical protein